MNGKQFITKIFVRSAGLALCLGMVSQAQAGPGAGQCTADAGTKPYTFSFISTMTDPSQNMTGKVIENAAGSSWYLSSSYNVTCGCSTMTAAYVTAISALSQLDHNDGTMNYYILNEYLAVGSMVWIHGGRQTYVAVPFSDVSNLNRGGSTCYSQPYLSGARGKINLYFRRPFVGRSVIPNTKLLDVYLSSTSGVASTTPVSTVSMNGTVIVPQNCDINPQPVTVEFGDILASNFTTRGAMPKNFTRVTKQLTLACTNISDGVRISLSFQGTPDNNDPTALKTNNDDIAVKIEDASGRGISPNSGRLPVDLNYDTQRGTTQIGLYPVNTTGRNPETGIFNAQATIRAEIQ